MPCTVVTAYFGTLKIKAPALAAVAPTQFFTYVSGGPHILNSSRPAVPTPSGTSSNICVIPPVRGSGV